MVLTMQAKTNENAYEIMNNVNLKGKDSRMAIYFYNWATLNSSDVIVENINISSIFTFTLKIALTINKAKNEHAYNDEKHDFQGDGCFFNFIFDNRAILNSSDVIVIENCVL